MKQIQKLSFKFYFILGFLFSSTSLASGFCVQTFNAYGPIYAARLSERTSDLQEELRKEVPCDLIQLQEVWNKGHQNKIEEILATLGNLLVLNPSRNQRVGLISASNKAVNHPYLGVYRNNRSNLFDDVRGLAGVKKGFYIMPTTVEGERFIFINTHLHPTSPAVRLAQLIELLQARLRYPNFNVVLTGDLNFDPHLIEYKFLNTVFGLRDAHLEYRKSYEGICTYCVNNPHSWLNEDKILDYVFYARNNQNSHAFKVKEARINLLGNGQPLSDHYGLRVDWTWEKLEPVADVEVQKRIALAVSVIDQSIKELLDKDAAAFEDSVMTLYHWRHELSKQVATGPLFQMLNKYY